MSGLAFSATARNAARSLLLILTAVLFSLMLYLIALMIWQPADVQMLQRSAGITVVEQSSPKVAAALSWQRLEAQPSTAAQALQTFRGAMPDGRLRVDDNHQLVVDRQLRHWLDGWLSVQGEWTLERVLVEMLGQINQLPTPGRGQAMSILDRWLDYRRALADYDERAARSLATMTVDDLQQRLEWTERLRRQYFKPEEVTAFFADDESLDRYLLARRQHQAGLADEAEVEQALQRLSPQLRQQRQQSRLLLNAEVAGVGGDSASLRQQRIEQFGEEAASRLASLDQRQQDWQQRLQGYQRFEASLSEHQSADDRQRQLQGYLETHFSAAEKQRIAAALQLMALQAAE